MNILIYEGSVFAQGTYVFSFASFCQEVLSASIFESLRATFSRIRPGNFTSTQKVDLVITLGGDGTVLWFFKALYHQILYGLSFFNMTIIIGAELTCTSKSAASMFKGPIPPIVPFSLGSLGFMTPFRRGHLYTFRPYTVRLLYGLASA
ncbi:hypothetical protein PVK06_040931 [Gossypium arboreum]|uniref:NAD(+) kinase n=1 Tax=Gossypium arboreum TaxID=29729 RepID=A0ABR0N900_GOSAR|nr:hypothetical protein PVK06_040931 [Gossypium arboreum]